VPVSLAGAKCEPALPVKKSKFWERDLMFRLKFLEVFLDKFVLDMKKTSTTANDC
jgi:hypothetical protein